MGRFTFFEYAQQNGHVMALLRDRLTKHHEVTIESEGDLRVLRARFHMNPVPFFEYAIPERGFRESALEWQARVESSVHDAWVAWVAVRDAPRPAPPEPPAVLEPETVVLDSVVKPAKKAKVSV